MFSIVDPSGNFYSDLLTIVLRLSKVVDFCLPLQNIVQKGFKLSREYPLFSTFSLANYAKTSYNSDVDVIFHNIIKEKAQCFLLTRTG